MQTKPLSVESLLEICLFVCVFMDEDRDVRDVLGWEGDVKDTLGWLEVDSLFWLKSQPKAELD